MKDVTLNRKLQAGSNTLISMVGALSILIAVNYLGMRHYVRADWTSSGIYTLSDKSLKVLHTLGKEVQMYMLWSKGDPSGRFSDAKEVLDRYDAASRLLKLEVLDQDLDPERVKMIIDRFGARVRQDEFGRAGIEAGVFVVCGENVKFVPASDFEDTGGDLLGGGDSREGVSGFKAEQSLTSAVMQVTSAKQEKICFTQGHDEWTFEGFGGRAIGHLKDELKQDGFKVEAISLSGASRVPKGCDLIVVIGPEKAFLAEEAALLEQYLGHGGRLMLFLDPVIDGTRFLPSGLEQITAKFGIKLVNDLVFEVDDKRLVSASPMTFIASEFSNHDAVKHLSLPDSVGAGIKETHGAYPVIFSTVRSLAQKTGGEAIAEILAKTSGKSWGEVDLEALGAMEGVPAKDQYDTQGPATIAMASTIPSSDGKKENDGRLIVVGDSDVVAEQLVVNAGYANRDFWSGLIGWLTSRGELISIAPKNPEHIRLNLTDRDVSTIRLIVSAEIVFFLLLGVLVWMRRRS